MQGYYWRQNELKAGKGPVASCKMLLVDRKQTNFLSVSFRHQSLQDEMAQHILPLFRLIVQIRLVIDLKIHFQMK